MSQQTDLFGASTSAIPTDRIFFAILPAPHHSSANRRIDCISHCTIWATKRVYRMA